MLNPDSMGDAVSEYVDWGNPLDQEPEQEAADFQFSVDPTFIDFGDVVVGTTADRVVTVANTGAEPIIVTASLEGSSDFNVNPPIADRTIAPESSLEILVTFSPETTGLSNAELSLAFRTEEEVQGPERRVVLLGEGIVAPPPSSGLTRVTLDSHDDFAPAWDPAGETIAFLTKRPPASNGGTNIGTVQSDGENERLIAVGKNQDFGLGHSLSWIGSSGNLMFEERIVFHEYLQLNVSDTIAERTVFDSDEGSFTRRLLVDGGGGGIMIRVSRDGSTALWRFSRSSGSGLTSIRTGPIDQLMGQSAQEVGTIHVEEQVAAPEQRYVRGAALSSDGSQFILSEPSGSGMDLFLYQVDGSAAPQQLTFGGQERGDSHVFPEISPDGTQVAFAIVQASSGTGSDIVIMPIQGGPIRNLTRSPDWSETYPTWSPDGERIAFQRFDTSETGGLFEGENPNWNIYVMPVDGGVLPADSPQSDFAAGDEDWGIVGDAQGGSAVPEHLSEGGNPGGHLCADDNVAGGVWFWQAPAAYLGNQSAAFDGVLQFDLKQSSTNSQFDDNDVILRGAGLTLVFDTPNNPGVEWTRYSIPLNSAAGWRIDARSGPAATDEAIQSVLSDLTENDLYFTRY